MAFSARETTKIKPILQLSSVFELVTLSSSADITLCVFPVTYLAVIIEPVFYPYP